MTLLAIAMATPAAHAAGVVSFSVDDSNTIGGGGTAELTSTYDAGSTGGTAGADDFAGLMDADWWGNSWTGSAQDFSPTNLLDDDGNATTVDISISTSNTWSAGPQAQDSDTKWNRTMLSGYANANTVSATVSEIPYTQYNAYVYFMSDDDSRVGTVTDGSDTYYFGFNPTSVTGSNPAAFNQATITDNSGFTTDANYAVFTGLTGASQTFSVDAFTSDGTTPSFGGISGIQIVQVPEPSAALLGGLGLLGLLRRRRP